jgi:hypothetical protein
VGFFSVSELLFGHYMGPISDLSLIGVHMRINKTKVFENVRNLQRDLGMLMLWNSKQKGYDLDDLIQLVETSNRQKRVVRIVERGVTRVSEPNVSLVLKSAELILLMSAIVNILNGKQLSKWRGMSPVSMENIALFVPA